MRLVAATSHDRPPAQEQRFSSSDLYFSISTAGDARPPLARKAVRHIRTTPRTCSRDWSGPRAPLRRAKTARRNHTPKAYPGPGNVRERQQSAGARPVLLTSGSVVRIPSELNVDAAAVHAGRAARHGRRPNANCAHAGPQAERTPQPTTSSRVLRRYRRPRGRCRGANRNPRSNGSRYQKDQSPGIEVYKARRPGPRIQNPLISFRPLHKQLQHSQRDCARAIARTSLAFPIGVKRPHATVFRRRCRAHILVVDDEDKNQFLFGGGAVPHAIGCHGGLLPRDGRSPALLGNIIISVLTICGF